MAETYRVAVIGCGGRGRAHAIGLKADRRLKVTWQNRQRRFECIDRRCFRERFSLRPYRTNRNAVLSLQTWLRRKPHLRRSIDGIALR